MRVCRVCPAPVPLERGPLAIYCSLRCSSLQHYRNRRAKGQPAKHQQMPHRRLARVRGKASHCVFGCQAARFEWANLTGDYSDLDDFAPMCVGCHRRFDAAVRATVALTC